MNYFAKWRRERIRDNLLMLLLILILCGIGFSLEKSRTPSVTPEKETPCEH